jgi:hypothetical protein
VVGVTVAAHDPRAMAARWAEVLGLAAPLAADGGHRLALEDGQVDFVATADRNEGITGFVLEVVDPGTVLAAARRLDLSVRGDAIDAFGTRLTLRAASG